MRIKRILRLLMFTVMGLGAEEAPHGSHNLLTPNISESVTPEEGEIFAPSHVEYVEHMGSDLTVVDAARVSFNKASEWLNEEEGRLKSGDERLINYLAKHGHWTPFGHCFVTFRVTAPIFVARQLMKHTVGLCWNEVSRRYVSDSPEFYAVDTWRGRPANMKQGSGGEPVISQADADRSYAEALKTCFKSYITLVEGGVAPEQARMVLPQSMMTTWYWSGSLAAWARVCKLRLHGTAQKETSDVARKISEHMAFLFPYSWAALMHEVNSEVQEESLSKLETKKSDKA